MTVVGRRGWRRDGAVQVYHRDQDRSVEDQQRLVAGIAGPEPVVVEPIAGDRAGNSPRDRVNWAE